MAIYNPICYSLYSDDVRNDQCLKRRFVAWDVIQSKDIDIFVCAEYFRLVYDKHRLAGEWGKDIVFESIKEVCSEFIPYFDLFSNSYSPRLRFFMGHEDQKIKFSRLTIVYSLIERPKIWKALDIHDAFRIILENPTQCRQLKADVANTIINWTKNQNLVKDASIVKLVRQSFLIQGNAIGPNGIYSRRDFSGYLGIDENAFIDLITKLINKL
jgi:hypothetical protein